MDIIVANITQTVGSLAVVESHTGNFDVATFLFGITVRCAGTFCGPDCSNTCVARNDSSGHFTCDNLQCMVCLPGFQNETRNCTDCALREGCCEFRLAAIIYRAVKYKNYVY